MFERSMVSSLVKEMELICGENNAEKVLEVTISLGSLSGVEEDNLKYWFQNMTKGTFAEDCKVTIERENAQIYCKACDCHGPPPYPLLMCMNCKSYDVEILSGDMVNIENMALI